MHGFQSRVVRRASDFKGQGEINITPFIDVVLVLLIIFMVAAPLSTVDVPLDLPNSQAAPKPPQDKPIVVSVQADLSLHVNDTAVGHGALAEALEAAGAAKDTRILMRADKKISYGDLMGVLDSLRRAGFTKVALIGLETADQ